MEKIVLIYSMSGETLAVDSTDYCFGGSLILRNGRLSRYLFDGGYCSFTLLPSIGNLQYATTFHYYQQDHLGNIREVINGNNGTVEQQTHYYPFGGIISDISTNQNLQPNKYNGKELDLMHGLNTYDYGARQYDPITVTWNGMDPLAEKYLQFNPLAYCMDNPVRFIDNEGMFISPIYDTEGSFLGTDDEGLQGQVIIMDKNDFCQNMSHADALSKKKPLSTQNAKDKFQAHYNSLPNRPDYDGYLTLEEANKWYREGNGEPLFTSLKKIDLSGITSLGKDYVGQVKSFNLLLGASASLNDGLVYGNITLKRYPNNTVRAYSDKYNFDMHNPWNPMNWGRNIETLIGKKIAGKGNPYTIHIYGSKKLTPIFPWIK